MQDIHYKVLEGLEARFGPLKPINDKKTGFQIGWEANLGEEHVHFNFTTDALRIFTIEKTTQKSKYKGLELLRQQVKKYGLDYIAYYALDISNKAGGQVLDLVGTLANGLDDIDLYFKTHALEVDEMGGGLRRIGSRRR